MVKFSTSKNNGGLLSEIFLQNASLTLLQKNIFLDAIASLDWGYESLSVCVIKPNNGYIAKHGAIIEYTLNVY